MEEQLAGYLLADNAITALVGQQVRWQVRPQASSLPALVLHHISAVRRYTNGGPSDLVTSRVQTDCWALTYEGALALSRAVRARLSGVREQLNGIDVQGIFLDSESHEYDPDAQEKVHRVRFDFEIWHSE